MCPTMEGIQSDISNGGTALQSNVADLELLTSLSHSRRSPMLRRGVSTVGDDTQPLGAVTNPESSCWVSAPVWDQSCQRTESGSAKLGTQRMEWQTKLSTWDFDVPEGSDGVRRTHGNDWGLQEEGVLFGGFAASQRGHFQISSSSGTTGSLDSASSGFPSPAVNCSNGLLGHQDEDKNRKDWAFIDKEIDVTSSDKKGQPKVSCMEPMKPDVIEQQRYHMGAEQRGSAHYGNTDGRTADANAPPKADNTKESLGCRGSVTGSSLKRTSCEDAAEGGVSRSAGVPVFTGSPPVKKHRVVAPGVHVPRCQVEGCRADLTTAKDYHRRHKVCEMHSKAPKVIASGIEQRFCQQCSRFHVLSEFDDAKRSCRRRLAGHNERRRKSSQDTSALSIASIFQDDRRQMNGFLDRSCFLQHPLAVPFSLYDNGDARRGWSRFDIEEQIASACRTQVLNGERQSHGSALPYPADKLLMLLQGFKGSTGASLKDVRPRDMHHLFMQGPASMGEGLTLSSSQGPNMLAGLEAAASASLSSPPGMLDSGRALSLLSSQALPTRPNHAAALEKLIGENAASLSHHHHHDYGPPDNSRGSQSTFALSVDKLQALPSSPRSIALSIGVSAGVVDKEQQDHKSLISSLGGVENVGNHPMLAHQLLQRHEYRSLGASSSQHARPTLDLMEVPSPNSQQNHRHHQQFPTAQLQAGSAEFSQHLHALRPYDASSIFGAHSIL